MFIIKNSGVKSISFAGGSTLTSIPEYAFSDCPALIEVRIPASVETIGGWAFGYSDPTDGLTSVIFEGNSLKTIGGNSFKNNSSLKNISLPDGLETIGAGAFKGTSISAVTIPGSVTEIGSEAFKCSSNILIHYFGSEEKWGDVHKDDGWTYNPDGVHFIVLRNMRATPDLDGGRMYACTTEGCDVRGDIIEKISRPFDFKLSKTSYTFDGTAKKPSVTEVKDEEGSLIDAADYKVSYSNNVKAGKTARVIVTFDSEKYSGSKTIYFTINKAANTFKIKAKTATVKYKKLRKKTQAIKVASVIRFVNKGQGAKTYVRVSGNKKISVNKKTGKVTIKKGLKKGKYKVKVKVKAAGDANYKASAYKTVTFVIKVK